MQQDDEEVPVELGKGKRRQPVIRCHYAPCNREIEGRALTCPNPGPGLPDLPHLFCSYSSMLAWAFYDVGGPICHTLEQLIEERAGHPVVADPAPHLMLWKGAQSVSSSKGSRTDPEQPQLMDVDNQSTQAETRLVACRQCGHCLPADEVVRCVSLTTAATWAFCSDACVKLHPGQLMDFIEFTNLMRQGHEALLRQPAWGTEPNDV